jgi:Tol biopolymer transport system component
VAYYTSSKRDLRIVDLETRQVTVVPGSDGMRSPRWSPDGRYVLAIQGASEGLALFDFATRQWRKLPVSGDTEYPWFSHDSRSVYFMRVGRNQGVFRIPVEGGKEDRVADMSDWHLTGYFGFSMTLDPDDAPLVLRDAGSDDIYALTLEEK